MKIPFNASLLALLFTALMLVFVPVVNARGHFKLSLVRVKTTPIKVIKKVKSRKPQVVVQQSLLNESVQIVIKEQRIGDSPETHIFERKEIKKPQFARHFARHLHAAIPHFLRAEKPFPVQIIERANKTEEFVKPIEPKGFWKELLTILAGLLVIVPGIASFFSHFQPFSLLLVTIALVFGASCLYTGTYTLLRSVGCVPSSKTLVLLNDFGNALLLITGGFLLFCTGMVIAFVPFAGESVGSYPLFFLIAGIIVLIWGGRFALRGLEHFYKLLCNAPSKE